MDSFKRRWECQGVSFELKITDYISLLKEWNKMKQLPIKDNLSWRHL
jgi:hypothetical protein